MFETPRITVIKFAVEDIITVSGTGSDNTQLPDEEL